MKTTSRKKYKGTASINKQIKQGMREEGKSDKTDGWIEVRVMKQT